MENLNGNDFYELCNANEWFTSGTSKQYEKLFDYVNNTNFNNIIFSPELEKVAVIIWVCSNNTTIEEIMLTIRTCWCKKNNFI